MCSFYGVSFFAFLFVLCPMPVSADSPLPIATPGEKRNPGQPILGHADLEDIKSRQSENPDSIWHRYKKPTDRSLSHYPAYVPNALPDPSKTYSKEAYKHLKNMALYCNYNWVHDKCMHTLSMLGIALTKDYLIKIHKSEKAPADLIEPAKKNLKEGCSGILLKRGGTIQSIDMSNGMKECVGTMKAIGDALRVYPNHELRQLALSSTFCIERQPRCDVVEAQLSLIAKPELALIQPVQNDTEEDSQASEGADNNSSEDAQ